jgi:DNA-binding HxlR family transcriptional regulator
MPVVKNQQDKAPTSEPKRKWPAFTERFGATVREAGVTVVPRVLLTGLAELKLKPMEAIVLLQLIACWGKSGPHPFPKRALLQKWTGCDKRTLDRTIASLVKKGFIEKGARKNHRGRQTSNEYNLSGLVEKLKPLGRKAINDRKRREAFRAAAAIGSD